MDWLGCRTCFSIPKNFYFKIRLRARQVNRTFSRNGPQIRTTTLYSFVHLNRCESAPVLRADFYINKKK